MEWIGFYLEFLCEREFGTILTMPGKTYGKTTFDAHGRIPWDFKAHVSNRGLHTVIANDSEATVKALDDYGHYGLVIAIGEAEFNDEDRTFKRWHDELKGGTSAYEKNRINRGAKSRRRKTEFLLTEIHFVCFNRSTLQACSGTFQAGFRNADGGTRRSKVTVDTDRIPKPAITATEVIFRHSSPCPRD